jgi:hypothetical protein
MLAEATLYQAFVEPFVDVASVAKLSAKRMINPLATFIAILNPWGDEKWIKDRMSGYDRRRDALANEWKELNKKINDGLGPDARLIMFFANPSAYLATTTAKSALKNAKDVALDATGLGQFIASRVGLPYEALDSWAESSENRFAGSGKEPAALAGIENRLSKLFFKEGIERGTFALREQEESAEAQDRSDISKEALADRFALELGVLGADAALFQQFDEWHEETESLVADIEERVGAKKKLSDSFLKIGSIADLKEYLLSAVELKALAAEDVKKMIGDIEKSAAQLVSDDDFAKKARELGEDPAKIADETVLGSAKRALDPTIKGYSDEITKAVSQIEDSIPTLSQLRSIPSNENTKKLIQLRQRLDQIKA